MDVQGTGSVEAVSRYHAKLPDQVKGEHLWIMAAVWRTTPGEQKVNLDLESLISIDGPGCFWCEEPWTPELASQSCRGNGR